MLHDRALGSRSADSVVLNPERHTPVPRDVDQEYLEHRPAVRGLLRDQYPQLGDDWEALYHDAWIELLEIRARDDAPVRNPRALLKTIAQRRAVDQLRRTKVEPIEPSSLEFEAAADELELAEAAEIKLTAEALRRVVETLEPRQATILKLRFDLRMGGSEIQRRMGITPKRMEKIFTQAYKAIAEQIEEDDSGTTPWSRRQRSLLLVCELGIATPAQRARAREILKSDPQCRAMLSAMRSAMRDVAVALPMPPAALELDGRRGPVGSVFDWAQNAVSVVRHPSADVAAARVSSTLTEQATGTLTGGLGFGGVIKIVAACVAIGGTAAVCVPHGGLLRQEPPKSKSHQRKAAKVRTVPTPAPAPVVAKSAPQPTTGQRVRHTQGQLVARAKARLLARREVPVSSPTAPTSISPAPAGATEFGPGGSGSDPVSPEPAPAPKNGGGEFGP